MSDGVLPSSFALLVERKVVGHVLIDLTQGQLFVPCVLDGHRNQCGVRIRRPDHLEKFLLAGNGQPAQVCSTKAGWRWKELPLVGAVSRLNVGRAVVPGQVRRGVDAGAVQPQVRVRGWRRVVPEAVAGRMRRRPLRVMVVQVLLINTVVVAVDCHVQDLLCVVVLNGTALLVRRLMPKSVHNPR